MMKFKRLLLVLGLLLSVFGLASCEKSGIQIGILQYATAGALDQAREGFIAGLEEHGYVDGDNIKIRVLNPYGNSNDNVNMAKSLVRSSDLILAIATPSATAVKVEADEQNIKTPILFTAVTDPVSAGLINSNEKPGGNITGTNDMNPINEQIELARELLPEAKKLGIIYSTNEINSQIQANIATEKAEQLGFEVITKTITTINDLKPVAGQLANNVDVIYVPTDNLVVSGATILNEISTTTKTPILIAEENAVPILPSLTLSINYYELGLETAKMAVKILNGEKEPKDIPSIGLSEFKLIVNKKQLSEIGITIPQAILDRADEFFE